MIKLGYLFTSNSVDRQVDHRIYRLIWVAVNFWGGKGWVSACHHCRIVPDDEDPESLAEVTHHLVLVLAKVPRQLPPQPGDGLQAHLVPAAKGVNSQGEEGDGYGAAHRLVLAQLLLVGVELWSKRAHMPIYNMDVLLSGLLGKMLYG